MKPKPHPASTKQSADKRRKMRPRPTPKWLKEQQDLDDIARRRCLMVLSVLSGEQPVTEAIVGAGISRGLYYQLEEKALRAMLRALSPGGSLDEVGTPGADGMLKRMTELEEQVKSLEQEKRRSERMLLLTRKLMRKGPVTTGRGRPPKSRTQGSPARPNSTRPGANSSTRSPSQGTLPPAPASDGPSTPTKAGETAS